MRPRDRQLIHVRDPIHGSIRLSPAELAVVETPVYQRLRGIKQLGFAEFAFPGATHSRFAHSLGAMQMASLVFDAIFADGQGPLSGPARHRLRQTLRLAVLLHDVGHAPLSHATEACMPPVSRLPAAARAGIDTDDARRANHEDYTIMLLLCSELADTLQRQFGDDGIDPRDVARLISGRFPERASAFVVEGIDYGPLLAQLVSGELDADRMDYLQRDSYYAGVSYGRFDHEWLLDNMTFHLVADRALQALTHRAVFAFEDFLLSRYHMFISVYYHHTSVGLDTMLARFIDEEPRAFIIPPDPEAFVALDDVTFWSALRASDNHWAGRIVRRQPYRRVVELNADEHLLELAGLKDALARAGIDYFISRDEGVLSRYYGDGTEQPIFVLHEALGQATRVERYSKVYQRYAQPTRLSRLYCRPDQADAARACVKAFVPQQRELLLPPSG